MGINFYARNRSCGKVMFSQACVIPSVHWGEGCMAGGMHGRGVCGRASVPKVCMIGGMLGRGCVWWEACVVGGVWQGACMAWGHAWQGDMRGRRNGQCSGR